MIVDRFQEGAINALVCTFGVGSVGLTLTRSHRVVLMDRPWTPGDVMQAEDRIRRIGQKHAEIMSYWVTAFDFDDKLDSLLESKEANSHKVLSLNKKNSWFNNTLDADTPSRPCLTDSFDTNNHSKKTASSECEQWNVECDGSEEGNLGNGFMKHVFRQLIQG